MESQLSRILATLKSPAFLASERAELLYLNEAMRQLVGGENTDRQRTLIGLGIFENRAEFRGFMRGFASVGSIQKIRLPSKRLRHTSREVLLTATFLPEEKLIFGAIGITEKPSLRAVATDTAAKVHYDDLPQLVVCTDGEGKLQYLNHVARSLLRVGQEPDAPLTGGIADVDAEYSLQSVAKAFIPGP